MKIKNKKLILFYESQNIYKMHYFILAGEPGFDLRLSFPFKRQPACLRT